MKQVLTLKCKLHTDGQQNALLKSTLEAYLAGCNAASCYIYETKDLSQSSVNKALYYHLRDTYGLRSQMAQSVIKTVIARYKSMRSNGVAWSKAVFRHAMADLVWNRDYSFQDGRRVFSVNTLQGRIKSGFSSADYDMYLSMPDVTFGTATLLERHGTFYLHVPVTVNVPGFDEGSVRNVVGIDRGMRFFATAYDSKGRTVFYSGKQAKAVKLKYAYTRKTLQQAHTASARRRLKQIGSRENRFMRDVNHRISKALVESYPKGTLFVLEDLSGIRRMTDKCRIKGKFLLVSWPFHDLAAKLEYKAAMHGQGTVYMNPAYTSQACPKCGYTERANRDKKNHIFKCRNCGYTSNDDRVAAMNLQRMGINYLVPPAVASV